jgi:uncharacterized protein (DUF2235 family)
MAKNIVLLSDGTGNSSAKLFKTNVWRLYQALDLSDANRQVAFYDDGVGTSSFKLFALLGGAFGFGLKRNVIDIYKFLSRNYCEGDRIFGFGFSRGSFTMRVVAGLVAHQGVVRYDPTGTDPHAVRDDAGLAVAARSAYRDYRACRFHTQVRFVEKFFRWLRHFFVPKYDPSKQRPVEEIYFLGLWDTVGAYGGPIEEVTRAIDYWFWPLSMPDQFMSPKIQRACHALSLDDERRDFWPILWSQNHLGSETGEKPTAAGESAKNAVSDFNNLPDVDKQRLSQVWFTGVHSDVGGGYSQNGLSYVTLEWMMDRARAYDLLLDQAEVERLRLLANKFDKLNDSRHGLSGYYRYQPRDFAFLYAADARRLNLLTDIRYVWRLLTKGHHALLAEIHPPPLIHESVFQRIRADVDGYSPIVLPAKYEVTTTAGRIVDPATYQRTAQDDDLVYELPVPARTRAVRQERVWNLVWKRRVVYFTTVFCSIFLALMPVIPATLLPRPGSASSFEFLIPIIGLVGNFLPGLAAPWLDSFKAAPGYFAFAAAAIAVLLILSGRLQGRIRDTMRPLWYQSLAAGPRATDPHEKPDGWIYRLRTWRVYRAFFIALTHWILPTAIAIFIATILICAFLTISSRLFFPLGSFFGGVCHSSERTEPVAGKSGPVSFDTRALCNPTGLSVVKGATYQVTFKITDPWEDGHKYKEPQRPGIPTDPLGFGREKMTWRMWFGLPFRRYASVNWFQPIVRVGSTGLHEQPLTFEPVVEPGAYPQPNPSVFTSTFRARASGEAFFFVNDSVVGLPGLADRFYCNNKGTAEITIEELRPQ